VRVRLPTGYRALFPKRCDAVAVFLKDGVRRNDCGQISEQLLGFVDPPSFKCDDKPIAQYSCLLLKSDPV
jgi:hypothetical protein